MGIAQDLILHSCITKRAAAFAQLSSGLSILGFLDCLKHFPHLFEKFFIFQDSNVVTAEKFLSALEFPIEASDDEARMLGMFREFVKSCSEEG